MTKKRRRRHTSEQRVSKLREADAMLNAGKDLVNAPDKAAACFAYERLTNRSKPARYKFRVWAVAVRPAAAEDVSRS
ncbi:MAG: hypothetical protein ACI8P0_005893 [Planctomycetaceae bacterium]|jgi:hypothetical protein